MLIFRKKQKSFENNEAFKVFGGIYFRLRF